MPKLMCGVTGGEYEAGGYSDLVHQFIAAVDESERDRVFRELQRGPIWPGGTLFELEAHSNAELLASDTPELRARVETRFIAFSQLFVKNGHHAEGLRFLDHLYRIIRRTEIRTAIRWHKGSSLFFLGISYLAAGNRLAAELGLMLAMIEDAISEIAGTSPNSASSLPAYRALVSELGLAQETVDRLTDAVLKATRVNGAWDHRDPEKTYLQAICSPHFWLRERAPLPFVHDVADVFFTAMRDATTNDAKGRTLELLAAYLFETADGFRVAIRASGATAENDLLVLNLHEKPLSLLGPYFVVSCKNWSDKVDVNEIRNLHDRLQEYQCDSGVLMARSGITSAAVDLARSKEKPIVVFDIGDLEGLKMGRDRLPERLIERFFKRVFDLFDKS